MRPFVINPKQVETKQMRGLVGTLIGCAVLLGLPGCGAGPGGGTSAQKDVASPDQADAPVSSLEDGAQVLTTDVPSSPADASDGPCVWSGTLQSKYGNRIWLDHKGNLYTSEGATVTRVDCHSGEETSGTLDLPGAVSLLGLARQLEDGRQVLRYRPTPDGSGEAWAAALFDPESLTGSGIPLVDRAFCVDANGAIVAYGTEVHSVDESGNELFVCRTLHVAVDGTLLGEVVSDPYDPDDGSAPCADGVLWQPLCLESFVLLPKRTGGFPALERWDGAAWAPWGPALPPTTEALLPLGHGDLFAAWHEESDTNDQGHTRYVELLEVYAGDQQVGVYSVAAQSSHSFVSRRVSVEQVVWTADGDLVVHVDLFDPKKGSYEIEGKTWTAPRDVLLRYGPDDELRFAKDFAPPNALQSTVADADGNLFVNSNSQVQKLDPAGLPVLPPPPDPGGPGTCGPLSAEGTTKQVTRDVDPAWLDPPNVFTCCHTVCTAKGEYRFHEDGTGLHVFPGNGTTGPYNRAFVWGAAADASCKPKLDTKTNGAGVQFDSVDVYFYFAEDAADPVAAAWEPLTGTWQGGRFSKPKDALSGEWRFLLNGSTPYVNYDVNVCDDLPWAPP